MRILSIETSCDETGVSIVEAKGGFSKPELQVLANITASQVKLHAKYGGVFPMMAKREHAKNLTPILKQVLKESGLFKNNSPKNYSSILKNTRIVLKREPGLAEALVPLLQKIKKPKIDAIAVTYGPGLEPTLWVGINFAKALSLAWNIPVIPINHMEGHIFSALMEQRQVKSNKLKVTRNKQENTSYMLSAISFPAVALLISGGHTELVLMKDWFKYKIIGATRDDAVGEAFDKVARILGLPYPGGPEISRLAKLGSHAPKYKLPRPMLHSGDFDFSFSGLKTAVLYLVRDLEKKHSNILQNVRMSSDIAREFENACVEVLVAKTMSALKKYKTSTLILGGGVSANEKIRHDMKLALNEKFPDCALYLPDTNLTGDNALMIAGAGYLRAMGAKTGKLKLVANPSAKGNLRL